MQVEREIYVFVLLSGIQNPNDNKILKICLFDPTSITIYSNTVNSSSNLCDYFIFCVLELVKVAGLNCLYCLTTC